MTIDDLAELGKECLSDYETKIKIQRVRPFDHSATKIAQRVDCYLQRMQPDEIRPVVASVLERLAQVGPLEMSEPKFSEPMSGVELRNIAYKDLRLSFTYGWSISDGTSHLWISCWYFPDNTRG